MDLARNHQNHQSLQTNLSQVQNSNLPIGSSAQNAELTSLAGDSQLLPCTLTNIELSRPRENELVGRTRSPEELRQSVPQLCREDQLKDHGSEVLSMNRQVRPLSYTDLSSSDEECGLAQAIEQVIPRLDGLNFPDEDKDAFFEILKDRVSKLESKVSDSTNRLRDIVKKFSK